MYKKVIIGTRGSQLALWQARYTQGLLFQHNIHSELKIIVTSGDKNQQWQTDFDKLEGKNFFTKEIEEALLRKEIDLAVHSFKDVSAPFFEGDENLQEPLIIAGLSERHPANDILILHKEMVDKSKSIPIKHGAKIGTSSARRYAQLKSLCASEIEILPLRGNIPTRIEKLRTRQYDGIIIARAGVERLNIPLNDFYVVHLPLYYFVPAAGQGIIAFQIRKEDKELLDIIQKISNKDSEDCSKIERYLLNRMGGGCSKPVGVLCEKNNHQYRVFISYNTNKEDVSILSIIEEKNFEKVKNKAEKNIQNLNELIHHKNVRKLFVSRKLEESSYLKRLMNRIQWLLVDKSLIETTSIEIKEIPGCDWIFFYSKNAVKYFFENVKYQNIKIEDKKFACIGHKTAEYLERYNISPDFVGVGNNIEDVGKQFLEKCNHQKVLFPCSDISLKSIEKIIQSDVEFIYLPVYRTIEKPRAFSIEFDYYVFTSPSNVRSFFSLNRIPEHSKIIAIGESTKRELVKHSVLQDNIIIPMTYDEIAIVAAVMGEI